VVRYAEEEDGEAPQWGTITRLADDTTVRALHELINTLSEPERTECVLRAPARVSQQARVAGALQDQLRLPRHHAWSTPALSVESGSSTRKVDPCPSSLDTRTRPPCASTMMRVI
jgi:hypothetical protein